jgi:hypothetical protein
MTYRAKKLSPPASEVEQQILFDMRFGSFPDDEGKAAPCRNRLCEFCFV